MQLLREKLGPVVLPTSTDTELIAQMRSILAFTYQNIDPQTYLAFSFTGDERLRYWSVVYDDAIRAIVHLGTGDLHLAKRTLDYFIDNPSIYHTGWVIRNGRWSPVQGWIINILDASEPRYGGRGIEHIIHSGPNIYLGLAAVHVYRATSDTKYLEFAKSRWRLIENLQNLNPKDANYGGIRMGPLGNPENPQEQKLNFKESCPSFYNFYNGEHAADFKALSDLLAQVDKAHEAEYRRASNLVTVWDRTIYDPITHLFFIGTAEKRYFDENIGQWINPGVIPMTPLDTSALKISAYGVDGLEIFEPSAAEKIRRAIDEHFKVTVSRDLEAGKKVGITGYDFVSHEDRKRIIRYEEEGPLGDIKTNKGIGRDPLVSDEWSTWVAFADLRLAEDFKKRGDIFKSRRYLGFYRDNALVEAIKTSVEIAPAVRAYPYAQPLPYALNKPVGFGWNTHHQPYSLIGGMARILGFLRYDPFQLDGGAYALHLEKPVSPDVPMASAKNLETAQGLYTEPELYVREGWNDVRKAQGEASNASARYWRKSIEVIERMASEHPDWYRIAEQQNGIARRSKDPFPLIGSNNLTTKDVYPLFKKYWALYHVGAGEFIRVMAYTELARVAHDRGESSEEYRLAQRARAAAENINRRFYYAQVYDANGWLWQPVQSLREYVDFYY